MAFSGFLIKLGGSSGTEFPLEYIKSETYKIAPNQRLESSANRAATGLLVRSTLEHTASKIEFETPPLNNTELATIMNLLRSNMTNTLRRDITIYYYDPETDAYKTADCYMPDVDFQMNFVDVSNNLIRYGQVRFAFIEY